MDLASVLKLQNNRPLFNGQSSFLRGGSTHYVYNLNTSVPNKDGIQIDVQLLRISIEMAAFPIENSTENTAISNRLLYMVLADFLIENMVLKELKTVFSHKNGDLRFLMIF